MSFSQYKSDFSVTAWDVCKPKLAAICLCFSIASAGLVGSTLAAQSGSDNDAIMQGVSALVLLGCAGLIIRGLKKSLTGFTNQNQERKAVPLNFG